MNLIAMLVGQEASDELAWQEGALCAQTDPDAFFPELGGHSSRAAKKVCAACEVQEQCLEYALRNKESEGIWGGTTPKERRRIAKQGQS